MPHRLCGNETWPLAPDHWLPTVRGGAGEGVVGEGHGGLAVHQFAEGVQVGVLEGVPVLPGLLGGGLVGGEEERGALHPHMTPLRLVLGGVGPSGASVDDII